MELSPVSLKLIIASGTLIRNDTWNYNVRVVGNDTIAAGVTLTILPGTNVYITPGKMLTVNGTLQLDERGASIVISDPSAITFGPTGSLTIIQGLTAGWNMVCVPDSVSSMSKSSVYPAATSPAWTDTGSGYFQQNPLTFGRGYFLNFPSNPAPVTYTGKPIFAETISVGKGWNMINALSLPIADSIVKPLGDSILTPFRIYNGYGYDSVKMLQPGLAYWVKMMNSGRLILNVNSTTKIPRGSSQELPPLPLGLQSYNSAATSTNSQRKIVRGSAGKLYLVFDSGGDIMFNESNDSGKTWTSGPTLNGGIVNCTHPAITERSGKLYVVFQRDSTTYNVLYNYSTDSGSTWLSNPITLVSGLTTPSPGPTPVIQSNPSTSSFELMIAWRDSTKLKSAFTTTSTPGAGNWTIKNVTNSSSSAQNPSLLYIPNSYPYWNLAWDAGNTIYYETYYSSGWSSTDYSFNPPYANSEPSVAVAQNNNIHLVWQGECSNYLPCIVDNKNLNSGVYTAFSGSSISYFSPSVTGHTGGRVTILWYDSQNNIDKVVYDGSNWGTPSNVATSGKYVTASIANPPGATAYSFWTTTTGPPYSIVTNSNGGPLQKGSAGWVYSRSVVIMNADRSLIASMELSPPILITPDGIQKALTFIPVSDSMVCTSDNVWPAFQTQSFSLPYGFTQGTIVASRSVKIGGDTIALPISFDIVNASTGAVVNTQTVQSTNLSDQLALPVQVKSGTPLRLVVHPNVVLGNNYSGMIIHSYTANDTGAMSKISLASVGYNLKPQDYALLSNYPNPFNPSTTIRYQLKDDGIVNLSVFNVLGQEVKRLVDEFQRGGYNSVNFEAANLSSGVYYVRLLVTDEFGKQLFIATEKLLLMK